MSILQKNEILEKLKLSREKYASEGFIIKGLFGSYSRDEADENSDIDVLVEATPHFASKYGFGAIARIEEIKKELSEYFETAVDIADSSGMGKTGKKFILDRAIYV